jgi:anti-sigma regulatory factor (Ser/Thr protein kinase)
MGFDTLLRSPGRPGSTICPLRPQADSVKLARDVTRSALRDLRLSHLGDDAALVVSELVTNAVRYTGGQQYRHNSHIGQIARDLDFPITLLLAPFPAHVLLAVADQSEAIPLPKEPDSISEHGRGLYIVETYSQSWGWQPLARGGKAVWALFRAEV